MFTVICPGRRISLDLGLRSYRLNGRLQKLPAKPVFLNGKCYVPLEIVQAVLPGNFTYDAKAQTVCFSPRRPGQARKQAPSRSLP